MDYYKLIINNWLDFIRVNNHQVTKNHIFPANKINSKLSFFILVAAGLLRLTYQTVIQIGDFGGKV